ncbi:chemokine (C-C motif) receptor 12a [Aplochiton taeniatus]
MDEGYEEDQYDLFLKFMNYTDDSADPSYVVDRVVSLCTKDQVNSFTAYFLPAFYYINFLLSLLGNGLVLCIVYKYEQLNTVTNIFLVNLVVSDLLFASSLPFWAVYHSSQWVFGTALCKVVGSLYFVGFHSSILFLTFMTFDRYLAVVHAVAAAKSRRRAYAVSASCAIWAVSVLASVKELALYDVFPDPEMGLLCQERGYSQDVMATWQLVGYYQQFFLFFLLPLVVVLYCYVQITARIMSTRLTESCRAVKLIFVIVFTFFVCWTPYNVVILIKAVQLSSSSSSSGGVGGGNATSGASAGCEASDSLDYAFYVTRNVAYLYCCVSPLFYTFLGKKFQSHFRRLLAHRVPCLKSTLSGASHSTRSQSLRSPNTACDY